MTNLELYELEGCPFCAKVNEKLEELGLDDQVTRHFVVGDKSQRDEVEEVSGQRGVPVLVDPNNGVEGMPESDDIVAYLEREYGDN